MATKKIVDKPEECPPIKDIEKQDKQSKQPRTKQDSPKKQPNKKKRNFFGAMFTPFSKTKKSWQNITTTKKWGVLSWGSALLLTGLLVYGTFFTTKEMGTFVIVVSCAWAEVAAYNAVYAWKAKCENRLKITYDFVERMADQYGIENITPILQSIIQD